MCIADHHVDHQALENPQIAHAVVADNESVAEPAVIEKLIESGTANAKNVIGKENGPRGIGQQTENGSGNERGSVNIPEPRTEALNGGKAGNAESLSESGTEKTSEIVTDERNGSTKSVQAAGRERGNAQKIEKMNGATGKNGRNGGTGTSAKVSVPAEAKAERRGTRVSARAKNALAHTPRADRRLEKKARSENAVTVKSEN